MSDLSRRGFNRLLLFVREYHPIVHVLLVGTVLARAASSMSMPFLAIYLSRESALSPLLIGAIIGFGSLAGMFGGFIGGALSDRLGRKCIMMIALASWVVVFSGFALAQAPIAFMLLNMLNGLCRSLYEPVSQALMADVTDKAKRLRVFSLRYMAINVGVAAGPLLGAYFASFGAWLPFLITAFIYLIYTLVLFALLHKFGISRIEGEQRSGVTLRSAWRVVAGDRVFRYYVAGGIVAAIGYSQMTVTLPQYVEQSTANGTVLFAWLMSLNAVTVVLLQVPLSRWAEKREPLTAIIAGAVMFALGDIGYALSASAIGFMLAMFLFTIGEIFNYPAANVLIDRLAPEGMRGTYFGAQTLSGAGHFTGPLIGGYLLGQWGGGPLFMTMAAITLAGLIFYWKGYRLFKIIQISRTTS